ncbi:MAG: hypothetical protein ACC707_12520 [Thiohalomonadales bacterium]
MGKLLRKELNFQAGEISPRFSGRSDDPIYDKGLAEAFNVIIDKHGGAFKRAGLFHVGRIVGDTARVFTLQVSRLKYYTLILHKNPDPNPPQTAPTELLIIAPGAQLVGSNLMLNSNFANAGDDWTPVIMPATSRVEFSNGRSDLIPEQNNDELVTDPTFNAELANWIVRETGSSTVSSTPGQITMTPQQVNGRIAGVAQSLTTGSVNEVHRLKVTGQFTANVRVQVGTAEDDGTYLDIDIGQSGELDFTPTATPFFVTVDCIYPDSVAVLTEISIVEQIVKTSAIEQTVVGLNTGVEHLIVVGQKDAQNIRITAGPVGNPTGDVDIVTTDTQSIIKFTPTNATTIFNVSANGDETSQATITFFGAGETAANTGLGIQMPAPWTEAQLKEVHLVETPEGQSFYFTHPNVQTQKLVYDFPTDTFGALTPVSFINKPVVWTGENWPATGTYFQGRLWLAGTPGQRQTIWASKSNTPEDFGKTDDGGGTIDPPITTDATGFDTVLQEFGRIEWMLGTKNLLVGSEEGEYILTSESGLLSVNDLQVEKQSAFGSNNMQAIQVGEKVFYLTPDGRKLRGMSYQWEEDNWLSQDLTFISEHITQGIGVHRCWAQHPNNLFILTLEDGHVATLTYDRTAQTVAWAQVSLPGMTIFDVNTARNEGVNEIVLVGQRVPGFVDIETNSGRNEFLDSYVATDSLTPINVVTGLDHLEGETVLSLVDGAVDVPRVVVGGQITTQNSGLHLVTGIPYTARIKTLPPDDGYRSGQIRSFKKRWNKVWALMLSSNAPIINGTRPPDRTPSTPMDTPEPTSSGHFKTVSLGWDDFGQITIEQDLPVAMHVLAIYGEMNAETL